MFRSRFRQLAKTASFATLPVVLAPHTKLAEWNRHQENKPAVVKAFQSLLPRRLIDSVDDKILGREWKTRGIVDNVAVQVPGKPDTVVENQVHVRGDGLVMTGLDTIKTKLADAQFHRKRLDKEHVVTLEKGEYIKGVSFWGYKYPGAPRDEMIPEAALTHSQVALRAIHIA